MPLLLAVCDCSTELYHHSSSSQACQRHPLNCPRLLLLLQVQAAIAAADEQASLPFPSAKSPRRSAATDWDLQHTAFATSRLAGTSTGADEISRSFAVGVGSADAVGARHALALGVEVAYRVSASRVAGCPAGWRECCTGRPLFYRKTGRQITGLYRPAF